jgi:hypothetical protein
MLTALAPPRLRTTSVLGRAATAARQHAPAAGRWAQRAAVRARTLVLQVAGLGAVTMAAWDVARPLGLAVGGASLLVVEALTGPADEAEQGGRR